MSDTSLHTADAEKGQDVEHLTEKASIMSTNDNMEVTKEEGEASIPSPKTGNPEIEKVEKTITQHPPKREPLHHDSVELIAQSPIDNVEGRRITLAVDTSQRSRDAFAWTIANLYRSGDRLSLIHVTPRPDTFMTGMTMAPVYALNENKKREARKLLSNYAHYCLVNDITHDARHIIGDIGIIVDQLTFKKENEGGSAAVVVGNHNKTLTEHVFMGSASEAVLHASHGPVVVVKRPHKDVSPLAQDTKRRIGVCVDNSEQARAGFDWMMKEMFREDDIVFVLHISRTQQEMTVVMDGLVQVNPVDAMMDKYSELLAVQNKVKSFHTVHSRTHKSLPEAMSELVESLGLDCLVMGCRHGRGSLRRAMFGSFSEGMLRKVGCNLVIVKA